MGPLFQMQYFALGVVAFYAVREQKQSLAIILMLLIALLPHSLNGNPMVFALLSGVAIMAVKNEDLIISHGSHRVLKFFSKYSFHIYLSHGIALSVAHVVEGKYFGDIVLYYCIIKFVIAVVGTVALCALLEIVQRVCIKCFEKNI